jgi:hypothetical protein
MYWDMFLGFRPESPKKLGTLPGSEQNPAAPEGSAKGRDSVTGGTYGTHQQSHEDMAQVVNELISSFE